MDMLPIDPANLGGSLRISGMAFGEALSREPRAEETGDATKSDRDRRADTRIGRVRPVESPHALSEDEQTLLRIFVARRGQCLCTAALERAFREATGVPASRTSRAPRRKAARALDAVIASLSEKLRASDLRWRVVAVEGCGYILWH